MLSCGNCIDCLDRFRTIVRVQPSSGPASVLEGAPRVTRESLLRHIKRYGDPNRIGRDAADGTRRAAAEVAADHGIQIDVHRLPAEHKAHPKGPTLKERIIEHLRAGRSPELIAEIEDMSPSRARRKIAEVQETMTADPEPEPEPEPEPSPPPTYKVADHRSKNWRSEADLLRAEGLDVAAIAARVGVKERTVAHYFRKAA